MVMVPSVRAKVLAISLDPATSTPDARTSMAPVLTSSTPGRMMMSVPTTPAPSASQRRARTFSPRKKIAPRVTKSGPVRETEVASARGMTASA